MCLYVFRVPCYITFFTLTSTANFSAICQGRMLIFLPKQPVLLLNFKWYNFFYPPRGQVVKKCFLKKALFAIFLPFLGQSPIDQAGGDVTYLASYCSKSAVATGCGVLMTHVQEFDIDLWNLYHVFGSGHKMHLKKQFLTFFASFLAQLLYVIFSVICLCRKLFNTIL